MITRYLKSAALILATVGLVAYSQTPAKKTSTTNDVKIRQRMGSAGGGVETVLYVKGSRMRSEMATSNLGMTTIVQCDLKRTLTIYEKTKSYMVTPTDGTNAAGTGAADGDGGGSVNQPAAAAAAPRRGGVVNVTHTITDTGERKEMFGFTARRIKTSVVKTASPDACDKDQKVETDGWYIDFQYAFECPGQTQKVQTMPVRPQPPGCQDEVRTKTSGTGKLGFPLLVTTTIYQPDGKTTTSTQEVLELSREPLSAALFEAPEGYTLAKNMQELYGMNAAGSAGSYSPSASKSNTTSTAATSASTATDNAGPKKAGVIRVGLVFPKVQLSSGNAAQAAEALRNDFATHLKTTSVETVALSARSGSAVLDEARQRECDYVLHVSMSVKKGGGGSMFGRAIGNIAGSAVGHVAGAGSASIKAKDEVTLEYKLEALDGARQGTANTLKAKASRDGEEVLSGLVEKAAGAVVATVSQKQ